MMAVIKWTLRQRRWSIFWWSIGLIAFVSLELGVYPSIKDQAAQLNDVLARMPSSVRALLGGSSDLFSPVGYLNSRLFYLLLPLMLSILAIGLGSSLIAREETDGTLELILARPIARGKLLAAKALAGFLNVAIVLLLTTSAILIWIKAVGLSVPLPSVAFAVVQAGLLSLLFGSIAFCLCAVGKAGRGMSIGVTALIGLGSYVVASLESTVDWLSWPARFLPYHYYNPTNTMNGDYAWGVIAAYVILIMSLMLIAWATFRRRDLA